MNQNAIQIRNTAEIIRHLKQQGALSRPIVNNMLEDFVSQNESVLGAWTCWEPNAFDGNDAAYANKPGSDNTGRYIPNYYRDNGTIKLDVLHDYDNTTPGISDWYQIPKQTLKESIVEPYEYEYNGEKKAPHNLLGTYYLHRRKIPRRDWIRF